MNCLVVVNKYGLFLQSFLYPSHKSKNMWKYIDPKQVGQISTTPEYRTLFDITVNEYIELINKINPGLIEKIIEKRESVEEKDHENHVKEFESFV